MKHRLFNAVSTTACQWHCSCWQKCFWKAEIWKRRVYGRGGKLSQKSARRWKSFLPFTSEELLSFSRKLISGNLHEDGTNICYEMKPIAKSLGVVVVVLFVACTWALLLTHEIATTILFLGRIHFVSLHVSRLKPPVSAMPCFLCQFKGILFGFQITNHFKWFFNLGRRQKPEREKRTCWEG